MAVQFPHVDVVGLDIVPPVLLTDPDVPENCRFEVDDANLSFSHYENAFNVVHMRAANHGINDFETWLYEIARTLRPNGVLLLVNGSPVSPPHLFCSSQAFYNPFGPFSKCTTPSASLFQHGSRDRKGTLEINESSSPLG